MIADNIQSLLHEQRLFNPPATKRAHIPDMATYEAHYARADQDPEGYWADRATELVSWFSPWSTVMACDFTAPTINWFCDATLNVSYNSLDRHV